MKIAEAGALELLLTMVPSSSLETRRQIARALANLSVNQANKDRLAELDGVSVLKVTLCPPPAHLYPNICMVRSLSLRGFPDGRRDCGVQEMKLSDDPKVQRQSSRALGNLLGET